MRRMTIALVGAVVLVGTFGGSLSSTAQTTDPSVEFTKRFSPIHTTTHPNTPDVRVYQRFGGEESLAALNGAARVVGRDVIVNGGRRIEFSTGGSHFIVNLTGGELTTVESDEEVARREGDRWTIGPGKKVIFMTKDDSATLDMLEITPAPR